MTIVNPTRDEMPMEMRHDITEAGQIDFVGLEDLAQQGFDLPYNGHEVVPIGAIEVGHFCNMAAPNHPTKSGEDMPLATLINQNDTHTLITP